jgi:hypothetical protein
LRFVFRGGVEKEINEKLNSVDSRLRVTIFVEEAEIRPEGGIIDVKDKAEQMAHCTSLRSQTSRKRY